MAWHASRGNGVRFHACGPLERAGRWGAPVAFQSLILTCTSCRFGDRRPAPSPVPHHWPCGRVASVDVEGVPCAKLQKWNVHQAFESGQFILGVSPPTMGA